MRSRGRGPSIIELLTIAAIIAVVAAILSPVLTSAKEKGRKKKTEPLKTIKIEKPPVSVPENLPIIPE